VDDLEYSEKAYVLPHTNTISAGIAGMLLVMEG
jgi:hypothetical protein